MKTKISILIIYNFLLCLLLFSCEKNLEVKKSVNLILDEDSFLSYETANSTLIGFYSRLTFANNHFSNGGMTIYPSLSADELRTNISIANYDVFLYNNIPSNNGTINTNFWSAAYRGIYHLNAIYEGVNKSPSISNENKNRLLGETLFLRAYSYFYLVNLFGEVPLILTTNYEENLKQKRNSVDEIYNSILNDLHESLNFFVSNSNQTKNLRVNQWVTMALLARVNLYLGNYTEAEKYSNQIIESNQFKLEQDLERVFIKSSTETIWQLQRDASNTAEASLLIPASITAIPQFLITDNLINSFEAQDQRKSKWINKNTVSGREYFYPYKYKLRNNTTVNENLIVFRLSEQYLIRGEAKIQLNKFGDGISDINKIRERAFANAPNSKLESTNNKELAIKYLIDERRREFFCEWGHRWFDLKRLNIINQVLSPLKPNWQEFKKLYPIPSSEILMNIYLHQNQGYEL